MAVNRVRIGDGQLPASPSAVAATVAENHKPQDGQGVGESTIGMVMTRRPLPM
jgi:hypothetical protein